LPNGIDVWIRSTSRLAIRSHSSTQSLFATSPAVARGLALATPMVRQLLLEAGRRQAVLRMSSLMRAVSASCSAHLRCSTFSTSRSVSV
jgi:hypothetical protein